MVESGPDLDPVMRGLADEVGGAYLAAGSAPTNPLVVDAYRQLQVQTDRLFHALVREGSPQSVRVVFTRCPEPYASDRELIAAVRACRILEVWTAAAETTPIHPVLDCGLGGAFDRFRAVHDLVGHVRTGLGFGLDDELAAWRFQDSLHGGSARSALATELLAVNSARFVLGGPPDQKATLLRAELLARARASVPRQPWPASGSLRTPGRGRPGSVTGATAGHPAPR